mgnify:CR=1 FL=1
MQAVTSDLMLRPRGHPEKAGAGHRGVTRAWVESMHFEKSGEATATNLKLPLLSGWNKGGGPEMRRAVRRKVRGK